MIQHSLFYARAMCVFSRAPPYELFTSGSEITRSEKYVVEED
jgi:hypothetical protein